MSGQVWGAFEHDPRVAAHAALRASDADRDVILGVLSAAYADGRLDREELDERAGSAATARTLGELPPLVADLVPERALVRPAPDALVHASPADLDRQATEAWQARRRATAFRFLVPSLFCWMIWLASGGDAFPWPLFVTLPTGLYLLRTLTSRQEIVREERRRLEKRQTKALRKRDWRA